MGAFFKSFWREMGRNTGKRVSNAMYGDKWSTPYRINGGIGSGGSSGGSSSSGCLGCLAAPLKIFGYIFALPLAILYCIYVLPFKWLMNKMR